MNLLPAYYKKSLRHERVQRFTVLAGMLVAGVLASWAVLLLPSYFFLFFQQRVAEHAVAFMEQSERLKRMKDLDRDIASTNKLLKKFQSFQENHTPINALLSDVFSATPSGIHYREVVFRGDKNSLEIRGVANRREDLDVFVSSLEKVSYVARADYPSNLLTAKDDVDFTMTVLLQ